jgi:hypothetical protein
MKAKLYPFNMFFSKDSNYTSGCNPNPIDAVTVRDSGCNPSPIDAVTVREFWL